MGVGLGASAHRGFEVLGEVSVDCDDADSAVEGDDFGAVVVSFEGETSGDGDGGSGGAGGVAHP